MCFAPWYGCLGGPRRQSRRQRTEALKDHIAELKDELEDAEERREGPLNLHRRDDVASAGLARSVHADAHEEKEFSSDTSANTHTHSSHKTIIRGLSAPLGCDAKYMGQLTALRL